jgi:SAM-dependent methyltransferase
MVPAIPRDPDVVTQYATEDNLAARQRLWRESRSDPSFSFHEWVVSLVDAPGRTLEVGCGNGPYLSLVSDVVGMDLSLGMLDAARPSGAPLVCGDAQAIPFASGSFEVVLAPHMLYHVPDRGAAARELRRVLRPGGVCVAATNGEGNHRQMVELVVEVVGLGWRWERPSNSAFSMENGADQLRAGFDVVETVYAPSRTFFVTDVDAFTAYLSSVGDHYQRQIDVPWGDVVAECGRRAAETIDRDGAFEISTSVGAFVCR